MLVTIQVLEQQDADNSPAPEGWDEEAPTDENEIYCQKPTEGRNLSDKLTFGGLSMPNISLPSFNFYKRIFIAIIVAAVLLVIGFVMIYLRM